MFLLNFLSKDIVEKLIEYKELKKELEIISKDIVDYKQNNRIIFNLHHQTEVLEEIILLFDEEIKKLNKKGFN